MKLSLISNNKTVTIRMYTARASFEWSHLWVLSERSGFGNLLVLVSSDCKYKRNSHRVVSNKKTVTIRMYTARASLEWSHL